MAVAATVAVLVVVVLGRPASRQDDGAPPTSDAAQDSARLLPNGGFVVSPSGGFGTDGSGSVIESFALPVRCGDRSLVVGEIPVTGRSFEYRGTTTGREAMVTVLGQVVDRTSIRGTVVAEGRACPSTTVAFTARIS